jgi:hypothetical protein
MTKKIGCLAKMRTRLLVLSKLRWTNSRKSKCTWNYDFQLAPQKACPFLEQQKYLLFRKLCKKSRE